MEDCEACHGTGGINRNCPVCHGTGKIRVIKGGQEQDVPCPMCNGSGKRDRETCPWCQGTGKRR